MKKILLIIFVLLLISAFPSLAHPGRLDSNGGHHDWSDGSYHYHDGNSSGNSSSNSSNNVSQEHDYSTWDEDKNANISSNSTVVKDNDEKEEADNQEIFSLLFKIFSCISLTLLFTIIAFAFLRTEFPKLDSAWDYILNAFLTALALSAIFAKLVYTLSTVMKIATTIIICIGAIPMLLSAAAIFGGGITLIFYLIVEISILIPHIISKFKKGRK